MCAQATHLLSLLVAAQALPGHAGNHCCLLTVMKSHWGWQHSSNLAVNLCCYTLLQLCAGIQVTVPAPRVLPVKSPGLAAGVKLCCQVILQYMAAGVRKHRMYSTMLVSELPAGMLTAQHCSQTVLPLGQ